MIARRALPVLTCALLMAGCSSAPVTVSGGPVCDSYIIFDMCVRDLVGDGAVDMVYFSNTGLVFMYRDGMEETVSQFMPMHRCAVSLDPDLQAATNRILERDSLSLGEEWAIKRLLFSKYREAKPVIDLCNARFAEEEAGDYTPEAEFYMGESDWEDEEDDRFE